MGEGLLLAVPYGILADTLGRRVIVALRAFGIFLGEMWFFLVLSLYKTFPIEVIYAYPLFFCIGGGGFVLNSAIYALIADAVASDMR
jgi:MFS family permease